MAVLRAPEAAHATAEGTVLDLHEGIATNDQKTGCLRWPEGMWLLATTGEVVRGRCKATNQCGYCATLSAVENAELLALDGMLGRPPTIVLTVTTPRTELNPAAFRESRHRLLRALRGAISGFEFAWIWELTTGYAENSGGFRRLHGNVLIKGHGLIEQERVSAIVEQHWCKRERASMEGQYVGEVQHMGGLMRYLALHFQKDSQAPPIGWKGHRFQTSRGYLWLPTEQAREAARQSLRLKREIYRAEQAGTPRADVERVARSAVEEGAAVGWRLAFTKPSDPIPISDQPPRALQDSEAMARQRLESHFLWELRHRLEADSDATSAARPRLDLHKEICDPGATRGVEGTPSSRAS